MLARLELWAQRAALNQSCEVGRCGILRAMQGWCAANDERSFVGARHAFTKKARLRVQKPRQGCFDSEVKTLASVPNGRTADNADRSCR